MRNSFLMTLTAAVCMATPASFAQNTLFGGLVPSADFMFYLDADQFSDAPIIEKIQSMNPEYDEAEEKEMAAKFAAATGLAEEDMDDVAFTVDLDNIDFQNQNPDQIAKVPAVMAVGLKKAISQDQLIAGIKLIAEQNGDANAVQLAKESREGTDLVVIRPTKDQEGPEEILATLSADGKTVLAAMNLESLSAASARIADKKLATPGSDMQSALRTLKGQPFRTVFIFPQIMKDQIAAGAQGNPMMASLATMQAVIVSAKAGETLDFNLKLDMANNQAASQATMMAQQMLPMAAMQLGAIAPQAVGAARKLKVTTEGNYVSVSINLTEADLEGGGAAPGGGGMMPPQ